MNRFQQADLITDPGKGVHYHFAAIHLCAARAFAPFQRFVETEAAPADVLFDDTTEALSARGTAVSNKSFRISRMGRDWLYATTEDTAAPCLRVSADYRHLTLYGVKEDSPAAVEQVLLLLRAALECRMAYTQAISLHGACVELDGQAFLLTGDSGVGKSTRAAATVRALGATWLSGDRPAICLDGDTAIACGMPWDGKEAIQRNARFPLTAVLDVRRSDSVHLRRLTTGQARATLLRQCFIPMWDAEASAAVMALVYRAAERVPVYRLFCGPDDAAIQMAFHMLRESPEQIGKEATEMKAKTGFVVRKVVGEHILMPTGETINHFDGAVVLSEVAAFLWDCLQVPITRDELLEKVLAEYDVESGVAACDLDAALTRLRDLGLLDESAAAQ